MSTGITTFKSTLACAKCQGVEVSRIDEERVQCASCGWITDVYEAQKAAESVNRSMSFVEEKSPENALTRFPGLSTKRFTEQQQEILEQKIPPDELDILPTGEVYASQVRYRRILNDAFGPGGWGLVPTGEFYQDGLTLCREYSLFAEGRFISSAIGEADFQPNNVRYSKATAAESLKSNALMRCCKDLGVASECWDKRANEIWKAQKAVAVWCVGKGDNAGKNKKLWRRRDAPRFEFPWEEKGSPPTEQPPPPDDVPAIDVKADVEVADSEGKDFYMIQKSPTPTPPPTPAEIAPPAPSQAKILTLDRGFVREFNRMMQKIAIKVGNKAAREVCFQVLGSNGFSQPEEVHPREKRIEIYRELQGIEETAKGPEVQP